MKGIHPHVRHLLFVTALCSFTLSGCRSNGGGVTNPFLAPDRVPPPATRALAPGQAQPYYRGDPLPVLQSATASPANAVAASDRGVEAVSSTGRTLAWSAPEGGPPANGPSPEPRTQAFTGEGAVAIPTDGDSLRFALPQPVAPQPTASVSIGAPAAAPESIQQAEIQSALTGVVPASYHAPAAGSEVATSNPPTNATPQTVNTPWQKPQIGAPTATMPAAVQPPVAPVASATPIVLPATPTVTLSQNAFIPGGNTMDVRLRAVPSPPPQPGDPMPRIRMPSYAEPVQTIDVAGGFRPRSSMR